MKRDSICLTCVHAVVMTYGEKTDVFCRVVSSLMDSLESCTGFERAEARLGTSRTELARFIVVNFPEISQNLNLRDACMLVLSQHSELTKKIQGLEEFIMSSTEVQPPRREGEDLLDWIRRGMAMGQEIKKKQLQQRQIEEV